MQYDPAAYDPAYYAQTPYGQAPNTQAPNTQAPYGQAPYGQAPSSLARNTQAPNAQTPYGQAPSSLAQYTQAPNAQAPYGQATTSLARNTQAPNAQAPYGQAPSSLAQGTSALVAVAVIAAVLIMLVIVLGTALLSDNIGESLDSTAAPDYAETLRPPYYVVVQKPATTPKSTPSPVVTTTTRVDTVKTTTAAPPKRSSSTASSRSTEYIPEEVGKQPLVCIVGQRLTSSSQLPADEWCDYIFYDSLYQDGNHNLLTDKTTYTESLNSFFNNRRRYQHTMLGVGFAFDFLAKAKEDLRYSNIPSPLDPFWNRGIFHAGILDTPIKPARNDTKSAVEILERIKRLVNIRRGVAAITAISVPHPEVAWAASFAEYFRELRFTPSLFISIGHYRLDDSERSICSIVPQTRHPDDVPPQYVLRDYNFDLSTPMYQLSWLYSNGTDTAGVVSVTMKGRWAHPESPGNVRFYDACVSEAIPFGSFTEVCPSGGPLRMPPINYSTEHHAMITYHAKVDRTFTYDDERAFAEKLCRVKALGTDVPFGIAVYDLDYDDYYNSCYTLNKYGANSRLKALRKIVDYFKKETAPFDETACTTFVTGERAVFRASLITL
ncbi:hypothetical protein MTO96_017588 [Rhipicephalus appendiculatus]